MRITHPVHRSRGAALIIGLVFLAVLTLIALNAIKRSGTDMQLSTNQAFEYRAFSNSEAGRAMVRDLIMQHADNDGVWSGITFPTGVTHTNAGNNLLANSEQVSKTPDEMMSALQNLTDSNQSNLDTDFQIRYDGNSTDGITDASAESDIYADIKVVKLSLAGIVAGTGGAQVEGYSGIGQGAASAGAGYIYFDVRSIGRYGDARAVTAADFRIRR
ncbi:pilus assembly PilX family protein [Thiorhodococcus fuscus]|uniref:PilX N-terminal domain-containing pilus assembly protein n=1 Tax=Thiorhodococcus fuscus TaxID=527200 RepID=A0ABW4Y3P6_9GAMM